MIKLQVLKTTDKKFIGQVFEFPVLPFVGMEIPIQGYSFEILFVKTVSTDTYMFGNYNYQVIAKAIE